MMNVDIGRSLQRPLTRAVRGSATGWSLDALLGAFPTGVTYSRASGGTHFGNDGLLKSVGSDVARFDYYPGTSIPRGLLVEPQRTNLLLWNRDLTNAAWTKANMTVAKTATGIDGAANSASRLTATGTNGTVLQAITSGSVARATTAYVRRVSGTGTVEMTQNGGTNWTAVTVTSQWTRVGPASATIINPSVGFRLGTSGDAIEVDYVQLENGTFASSAIGTVGSAATRAQDVGMMSGAGFTVAFPAINTEGTVVLEVESAVSSGSTPAFMMVFSITDGTASNRFVLEHSLAGNGVWRAVSSGNTTISGLSSGALQQSVVTKRGLAFKGASYVVVADGAVINTQSSGAMPVGMNQMAFGGYALGSAINPWFGWVRSVKVYPASLPDGQLQALTQ